MSFIRVKAGSSKATVSGIDYGNAKPIEIVNLTDRFITLKIPGGKHWTSTMTPPASHPGQYKMWEIINIEDKGEGYFVIKAENVVSFALRPDYIEFAYGRALAKRFEDNRKQR